MQVVYITDKFEDLTKGNTYFVLGKRKSLTSLDHEYLVKNDLGEQKWFGYYDGIITFAELYNKYIRFIGADYDGLTKDRVYQLCGRDSIDEYYYFVNDYNKFVGIPRINYFGGAKFFDEFDRNDKIDSLLQEP